MFRYIFKTLISHRNVRFIQTQSASNKTKLPIEDKQSPTVSYLINSCGLSLESAIKASKLVKVKNIKRSDSVLELFRDHGFSQNDISKLISKWPHFISADPVKILRPKLEFAQSLGIARTDLPRTFMWCSKLLKSTMNKGIKPALDLLKCYADPSKNVARTLVVLSALVSVNLEKVLLNVETLRNHNVPETQIGKIIMRYPKSVVARADTFKEVVTAISEMGIDPKCQKFLDAVALMTILNNSLWERKKETLLSLGWTESEFELAFSVQPVVMFNSEEKMRKMMDFLVNKVGLKASDVARCPTVLQASLEKRIIPRWSVLQILKSEGLLKKKMDLIWQFTVSKKVFEDSMVNRLKNKYPEIVKAYENQSSSGEFSKAGKDA